MPIHVTTSTLALLLHPSAQSSKGNANCGANPHTRPDSSGNQLISSRARHASEVGRLADPEEQLVRDCAHFCLGDHADASRTLLSPTIRTDNPPHSYRRNLHESVYMTERSASCVDSLDRSLNTVLI